MKTGPVIDGRVGSKPLDPNERASGVSNVDRAPKTADRAVSVTDIAKAPERVEKPATSLSSMRSISKPPESHKGCDDREDDDNYDDKSYEDLDKSKDRNHEEADEIDENTVGNEEREAVQVTEFYRNKYGGTLPFVGIGMQNYLKKLDEIEKKATSGYYSYQSGIDLKNNKYKRYIHKLKSKITATTDAEKCEQYEAVLNKLVIKLKNVS